MRALNTECARIPASVVCESVDKDISLFVYHDIYNCIYHISIQYKECAHILCAYNSVDNSIEWISQGVRALSTECARIPASVVNQQWLDVSQ